MPAALFHAHPLGWDRGLFPSPCTGCVRRAWGVFLFPCLYYSRMLDNCNRYLGSGSYRSSEPHSSVPAMMWPAMIRAWRALPQCSAHFRSAERFCDFMCYSLLRCCYYNAVGALRQVIFTTLARLSASWQNFLAAPRTALPLQKDCSNPQG